jgi:acyl-ACP thioesterase
VQDCDQFTYLRRQVLKNEPNHPVDVWTDKYDIHSYEVDIKARATFPFLCQFMQESAWKHAENLGLGFEALQQKNLVWVLARQLIEMDTYPRWGDNIKIHTWATGQERLFWYRDFKILDSHDHQLGKGSTAWFVIDLDTRRPQRTSSLDFTLPDSFERMFEIRPGKIPSLKDERQSYAIRTGYRHIDVNQHVNNVRYLEWMLEGFDIDFHRTHNLHTFEVNYLSEATYGDDIAVVQQTEGNLTFLHSLQNTTDQTEICRARTVWRTIDDQYSR